MLDARIWIILALLKWPDSPIKFYISHFPKSRGSFFKAKTQLTEIGVIETEGLKRGYLVLDPVRAVDFMLTEYPGLDDITALIIDHADLVDDDDDMLAFRAERRASSA